MPAGSPSYFSDNVIVQSFRDKVRQWWGGVLRVRDSQTYGDKDLIAMKKKILDRAYWIRDKIKLLITSEEAKTIGLDGGPAVLVWPVAIAGIVAYMTYQLTDFAKFYKRQAYVSQVYNDIREAGGTAQEAAKGAGVAADQAGMPSAEATIFGVPVKWLAIGAIGVGVVMMMKGKSE